MATHDYNIANSTGANVRSDINNVLAAIASNNSNGTDPGTTFAYQWYADTGDGKMYIRNAANNAYIEVGTMATANLGLASLGAASNTFTGEVIFNNTSNIQVAKGTTGERPGSPTVGDFRYNTTTHEFEGYSGSSAAWGSIGGGGGATGGGTEAIFHLSEKEMNTSYEIEGSGANNAGVWGPLTIAASVVLTIPAGTTLHVI